MYLYVYVCVCMCIEIECENTTERVTIYIYIYIIFDRYMKNESIEKYLTFHYHRYTYLLKLLLNK